GFAEALRRGSLSLVPCVTAGEGDACEPRREAHLGWRRNSNVDEHTPTAVGLLAPHREVVAVVRPLILRLMIDERARSGEPAEVAARRDVAKPRLPEQFVHGGRARGLREQSRPR